MKYLYDLVPLISERLEGTSAIRCCGFCHLGKEGPHCWFFPCYILPCNIMSVVHASRRGQSILKSETSAGCICRSAEEEKEECCKVSVNYWWHLNTVIITTVLALVHIWFCCFLPHVLQSLPRHQENSIWTKPYIVEVTDNYGHRLLREISVPKFRKLVLFCFNEICHSAPHNNKFNFYTQHISYWSYFIFMLLALKFRCLFLFYVSLAWTRTKLKTLWIPL
jgi:hypothetical protein